MENSNINRRNFLAFIPAATLATKVLSKTKSLPISCNSYNWHTFYNRIGKNWGENLDENVSEFSKTGIKALEPSIDNKEMAIKWIAALKKYNIALPSIYVNSSLHDQKLITESFNTIIEVADVVKTYGTKIIVTNPNPIKWGGNELKSDAQLAMQAKAMEDLGKKLRQKGITLAYHTHDIELKAGAREFHHILLNTSPQNVSFCFDTHWVYRGSENSQAAVFDVLKLYGNRIVELHVRQSMDGVWSETFTATGDIDYNRFARELSALDVKPHIVIEQCIEAMSPNTLTAIEAHKINLAEITKTFHV